MTTASFLICIPYALVAGLAVHAAMRARANLWPRRAVWGWLAVAVIFIGLIAFRLTNGEDLTRQALRDLLMERHYYESRRALQRPLAALLVLATSVAIFAAWRWWPRGEGRPATLLRVGILAAAAYVPLNLLRIVSLHDVDRLLYARPVPPNWIVDFALTLIAGGCALSFARAASNGPWRQAGAGHRHRG